MTYGIEIKNEFGEQVIDFTKSLTIKESGQTITAVDLGITNFEFSFWAYRGPSTGELLTFTSGSAADWLASHPHFLKDSTELFPATFYRYPAPLVDKSSLYFYQVGTIGLAHHSEHTLSPPWTTAHGMFAVCLPANNTPLPFLRVDVLPQAGLTGDYAMQIFDAAGGVVFDSRSDFLSISEVFFVTKATVQNILDNNAVVNLTLRTSTPGAYVAAPNHTSFFRGSGPSIQFQHVLITQPDASTIRLARYSHGPAYNSSSSPPIGINNYLIIIVARNPFA